MYSARFAKEIIVTEHARARMADRDIDEPMLADLIETGNLRRIDDKYMFLFKHFSARNDNLVCAAAVEEDRLVVKTVMINWTLREPT